MSGIVGSRFNIRGSGLVSSLGADGHALTSSGAGTSIAFEAAGGSFGVGDITGATALAEEPAITDEIVISDGGTLKRLDLEHMMGVPFIALEAPTGQTITTNTSHIMTWDTVTKQVGGTWANNTTFTPGVAGFYFVYCHLRWASEASVDSKFSSIYIYKNGSHFTTYGYPQHYLPASTSRNTQDVSHFINVIMDADDYIEIYAKQESGVSANVLANKNQLTIWRAVGAGTS